MFGGKSSFATITKLFNMIGSWFLSGSKSIIKIVLMDFIIVKLLLNAIGNE